MMNKLNCKIKHSVIILLFILVPAGLSSQELKSATLDIPQKVSLQIDNETSWLTFFLKGNVHDTLGSPEKIVGSLSASFSKAGDLLNADGGLKIDAKALDTKDKARDKRMKKKFLHVEKYPDITFDLLSFASEKTFNINDSSDPELFTPININGDLTIHGVKKTISILCKLSISAGRIILDGELSLFLQDYEIKNPSLLFFRTSNEVKIKFHIVMTGNGFE